MSLSYALRNLDHNDIDIVYRSLPFIKTLSNSRGSHNTPLIERQESLAEAFLLARDSFIHTHDTLRKKNKHDLTARSSRESVDQFRNSNNNLNIINPQDKSHQIYSSKKSNRTQESFENYQQQQQHQQQLQYITKDKNKSAPRKRRVGAAIAVSSPTSSLSEDDDDDDDEYEEEERRKGLRVAAAAAAAASTKSGRDHQKTLGRYQQQPQHLGGGSGNNELANEDSKFIDELQDFADQVFYPHEYPASSPQGNRTNHGGSSKRGGTSENSPYNQQYPQPPFHPNQHHRSYNQTNPATGSSSRTKRGQYLQSKTRRSISSPDLANISGHRAGMIGIDGDDDPDRTFVASPNVTFNSNSNNNGSYYGEDIPQVPPLPAEYNSNDNMTGSGSTRNTRSRRSNRMTQSMIGVSSPAVAGSLEEPSSRRHNRRHHRSMSSAPHAANFNMVGANSPHETDYATIRNESNRERHGHNGGIYYNSDDDDDDEDDDDDDDDEDDEDDEDDDNNDYVDERRNYHEISHTPDPRRSRSQGYIKKRGGTSQRGNTLDLNRQLPPIPVSNMTSSSSSSKPPEGRRRRKTDVSATPGDPRVQFDLTGTTTETSVGESSLSPAVFVMPPTVNSYDPVKDYLPQWLKRTYNYWRWTLKVSAHNVPQRYAVWVSLHLHHNSIWYHVQAVSTYADEGLFRNSEEVNQYVLRKATGHIKAQEEVARYEFNQLHQPEKVPVIAFNANFLRIFNKIRHFYHPERLAIQYYDRVSPKIRKRLNANFYETYAIPLNPNAPGGKNGKGIISGNNGTTPKRAADGPGGNYSVPFWFTTTLSPPKPFISIETLMMAAEQADDSYQPIPAVPRSKSTSFLGHFWIGRHRQSQQVSQQQQQQTGKKSRGQQQTNVEDNNLPSKKQESQSQNTQKSKSQQQQQQQQQQEQLQQQPPIQPSQNTQTIQSIPYDQQPQYNGSAVAVGSSNNH